MPGYKILGFLFGSDEKVHPAVSQTAALHLLPQDTPMSSGLGVESLLREIVLILPLPQVVTAQIPWAMRCPVHRSGLADTQWCLSYHSKHLFWFLGTINLWLRNMMDSCMYSFKERTQST